MGHIDKLRSTLVGGTKVAFMKDNIVQEIRVYDHTTKGEWDRRVLEETEWEKQGDNYYTKFVTR